MPESMDALDKMLLGEAPNEIGDDGVEQDTATNITESKTQKTGEVHVEGANGTDDTLLVTTATAVTDQLELDDVSPTLFMLLTIAVFVILAVRYSGTSPLPGMTGFT